MDRVKLPPPVSGGLLLTYKCSASCRHCMYACSPKWKDDWISDDDLDACLSVLRGKIRPSPWGPNTISLNHGLHFTGGEPFLNFEGLLKAVRIADTYGIPSTFVETNCFWSVSDAVTREKLRLLKRMGLKGILISVNPFYAEYVPFERTERCIRISFEVFKGSVAVYQPEYFRQFRGLGVKKRITLEDYMNLAKERDITGRVELFLMGRAALKLKKFYRGFSAERYFDEPCEPPFLREWHNHFDNYGNIMPGYCGGISLGHWKDMDRLTTEGIDVRERPVLGFLISGDMRGLLAFARDLDYEESPEGYISKCDLCLDVRRHLVNLGEFEELRPAEFYEHLD